MNSTDFTVLKCVVCGDRAAGYKYNGLCCESCKMFFKRYSTNHKKLNCLKDGSCDIDIVTRKNCRKCRLQKCYSKGMLRQSGEENRPRKAETSQIANLDHYIQNNIHILEYDNPNPIDLNLPSTLHISWGKKKYISELFIQERELIANVTCVVNENFVEESKLPIVGSVSSPIDTMNLTALYIRRIVRFCKSIPAFKQLKEHDQLIVLKPFFFEMLSLRFAYNWDFTRHGFPLPMNESTNKVMFVDLNHFRNLNSIENGIQFQHCLNDAMENDFTIRDLITALLLFKPRDSISNVEFIHYQYSLYRRLLFRYLEHKYANVQNAKQKFRSILRVLDNFDRRREGAKKLMISEANFGQLAEIIIEVFNVNV